MSYMPRPDAARTTQDVADIYALTADELQKASTNLERREAFRIGILRAYEGGIDAQREVFQTYQNERPTPVPPAPQDLDDPGTLPDDRSHVTPIGHAHNEPRKPR